MIAQPSQEPTSRPAGALLWGLCALAALVPLAIVGHMVLHIQRAERPAFLATGSGSEAPMAPAYADAGLRDTRVRTLHLAGSGSNLPLTRILARAYRRSHPEANLEVHDSIGSSGGIRAVLDGAISLGLISRPLSDAERGRGLVALPYARTAVVVAANAAVPAQALSSAELLALYGGTMRRWSDGSRVVVIQREHGDSSHRVFDRLVSGFAQHNETAYREHRWRVVYSDADMLATLTATEGAVGLLDSGAIQCLGQPLRALSLDGVAPTLANLDSGAYPFHKDLAFLCAGQPAGLAADFLEFVFSAAGRRLIENHGYLPLGSAQP